MSTARFKDRIVYLTGAASGIGQAAAVRLAAEGAKVFAVDVNEEGVQQTVATIREAGGTADGGLCDVSTWTPCAHRSLTRWRSSVACTSSSTPPASAA